MNKEDSISSYGWIDTGHILVDVLHNRQVFFCFDITNNTYGPKSTLTLNLHYRV